MSLLHQFLCVFKTMQTVRDKQRDRNIFLLIGSSIIILFFLEDNLLHEILIKMVVENDIKCFEDWAMSLGCPRNALPPANDLVR